jgi:hypothetical protein
MESLPEWAEDTLKRFGPQPAFRQTEADQAALAKYEGITARLRRRWRAELETEVWPLFHDGHSMHEEQAQHLLGLMIDLARYGSRSELHEKRAALAKIGEIEDEIREMAARVIVKLKRRADLMHDHLVEGGLDDQVVRAFICAAEKVETENHFEPRLLNSDFAEAVSSRKSDRDALNAFLFALDRIEFHLLPVKLTDRARATIFNVAHDASDADSYDKSAIKTARADIRRR